MAKRILNCKELAKRAKALGMKVIYTNRSGKVEGCSEFAHMHFRRVITTSVISFFVFGCRYLSLHIPFSKAKGAVIGKGAQFEMMKDRSNLINCLC